MARRDLPEVNASSMADIAFLLLTFFLIATTLNKDVGIQRTVPDPNQPIDNDIVRNKRNTYRILVNQMGQIQINGENAEMSEIKQGVMDFVDNGGGVGQFTKEPCDYCQGARDPNSSDTPQDAVVSLELDYSTPYNYFFTVENYIDQAYNELRNNYAQRKYNISYEELQARVEKNADSGEENEAKADLDDVNAAYPKIIAKARLKKTNR